MFPQKVDISDDEIAAVDIVRDAVNLASNEAKTAKSYIAPKHLLLGLGRAIAGALPGPTARLPFSADARAALEMAIELGREHPDGKVTVSDLLTALATVNWPAKFRS